jgi:hypothetical protein
MAYSSSFPPAVALQAMALGGGSTYGSTVVGSLIGGKLWVYISSHTQAEVGTSDFLPDGTILGYKVGDAFENWQIAGKHSRHRVTAVGSTFVGLSVGFCISSAS